MNLQLTRTLALVSQCWIMNLNSTTLVQCLPPNVGCYSLSIVDKDRQNPLRLWFSSHSQGWSCLSCEESWSTGAHCWRRCRSWAHNLWIELCRPDGQTVLPTAEWRSVDSWLQSYAVCSETTKVAWNRTMTQCAGRQGVSWYQDRKDSFKGHPDDFSTVCSRLEPHTCVWK